MFNVAISGGGTHAGWRRPNPQPEAWECDICDAQNERYLVACKGCKNPRRN